MKLTEIDIWLCENCGYPEIIEDGGFYPEGNKVSSPHPGGWIFGCSLCGHETFVKVPYVPKDS